MSTQFRLAERKLFFEQAFFFQKFGAQVFFGRQMPAIGGGDDARLAFGQSEFDDGVVFVGAEQNADGRVFIRRGFHSLVIIAIHLHLSDVLMRQFSEFEVDEREAPQGAMVKREVNVEVVAIDGDAFLTSDEEEIASEFQEKFLQMVDDGLFQIFFLEVLRLFEVEKFQDHWVFETRFLQTSRNKISPKREDCKTPRVFVRCELDNRAPNFICDFEPATRNQTTIRSLRPKAVRGLKPSSNGDLNRRFAGFS